MEQAASAVREEVEQEMIMASVGARSAPTGAGQLSSTALAAILTGVGVVMLGLFVALVILLVRAVRTHKRLLKDLEHRGLVLTQANNGDRTSIAKPRAVLRKSVVLPFNARTGWGTLPSVETIASPEPPSLRPHAPSPATNEGKSTWPFATRRSPKKAFQLKRIRAPQLSTVIESPKPSPLVPVLNGSQLGGETAAQEPSSDLSLLRRHPALRDNSLETPPEKRLEEGLDMEKTPRTTAQKQYLRRSLTAIETTCSERNVRPGRSRSKSATAIPSSTAGGSIVRLPHIHGRSASLSSQTSGQAPEVPMPPLPLEIARVKSDERRRSLLNRSPSRLSISSYESGGSSILVTQSSPVMPRPNNVRVQKVAKRHSRNPMVVGPRSMRDTLTLHGKSDSTLGSIRSSVARHSSGTPNSRRQSRGGSVGTNLASGSVQSMDKFKFAEAGSPFTMRTMTPTKRTSGSFVNGFGSPQERRKSVLRDVSGNQGPPTRQLSQASTQASSSRSSNGNPFQWDPTPLLSMPSALKGSPSARGRKGHRKPNAVRISLAAPTILGPPSRLPSPSPSFMKDIKEESPETMTHKRPGTGLGFSNTRSLPNPPSSSVFAPDVKFDPVTVRASLTSNSPTLSLAPYHQDLNESPTLGFASDSPFRLRQHGHQSSDGSLLTIPTFPSPCHDFGPSQKTFSTPPAFGLYTDEQQTPASSAHPSNHFYAVGEGFLQSRYPEVEEYDPTMPLFGYEGLASGPPSESSSPFRGNVDGSTSPTRKTGRLQPLSVDSPPCSPKTLRPPTFPPLSSNKTSTPAPGYNGYPITNEVPLEFIDPAILSPDFAGNRESVTPRASLMNPSRAEGNNMPAPEGNGPFAPSIDGAFTSAGASEFPPNPTTSTLPRDLSPHTPLQQSPCSSIYSAAPSSPPSPLPSCSPRPKHATLPALTLTNIPTLTPSHPSHHSYNFPSSSSPAGPRASPPRDLRRTVLELRRMNSDAKDDDSKASRRYLRLGRGDSICLPGEESWLEGLSEPGLCFEGEGQTGIWNEGQVDDSWDERGEGMVRGLVDDWGVEADKGSFEGASARGRTRARGGVSEDTSGGAQEEERNEESVFGEGNKEARSSSVWEDGEKFWCSTPPHPISDASTGTQPLLPPTTTTTCTTRKRAFEVAKDGGDAVEKEDRGRPREKGNKEQRRKAGNARYRKRDALGISTPNMRILVQPPSSDGVVGVMEVDMGATPGSLYDGEGFLRV